jgi:hypothetical protein
MKRWFYIRLVTTAAMVLLIIVSACFHVSIEFIFYDIFYTLWRIYSLWVVYIFVGELVHEDTFFPRKQPHPDFSVSVISTGGRKGGSANNYPQNYENYKYGGGGGAANGAYIS